MKKQTNLAELIAILFKAFEKDSDEELAELYYQRLAHYDLEKVQARILGLIDTAKFFPRIGEILDYASKEEKADEIKFLARFRKQATSPYAFDEMDDDIFTVKKYIGPRTVEDAYARDWHWIEKKAVQIYQSIREKHIEVIENPNKHRVKILPSGSRYIEPSSTIQLKKSVEKLGQVLPKLGTNKNFALPMKKTTVRRIHDETQGIQRASSPTGETIKAQDTVALRT